VRGERGVDGGCRSARHRGPGEPEQALDVQVDLRLGEKGEDDVVQHHAGRVTERAPGVVRGGVQPWPGLLGRRVGPAHVEDLLAVQATAGCQGQELDQPGRRAPCPRSVGDDRAIDDDPGATEQSDRGFQHGWSIRVTKLPLTVGPPHRKSHQAARWV
jgi:hypothetical protein